MKNFVHLHVHTEFSVLDGLGSVTEYVDRALLHEMPALAITDHGNMCGAPSFYGACRKANVEPILGQEFYFVPDAAFRPAKGETASYERFHVVMLARGREGYRLLSELSTHAHKQFYYKPIIDRAALEGLGDASKHLTVLSGCAASIISKRLLSGDREAAETEVMWWRELFPHFYIELQHHDTDFDRKLNKGLIKLAKKFDIPWVITNDPHYAVPEDDCYHDALLAIQTGSDIDDPARFKFDGFGYHLRDRKEMRRVFDEYGRDIWLPGLNQTLQIAKDCHIRMPEWESRTYNIPKFPDTTDAYAELKRLTIKGLKRMGFEDNPEYVARYKRELKVIKTAGIADFLMITLDCIKWAQEQDISVGPGRGSVCGTLVGYLVGIHKIDPVKYKLLFERFLNPARPKMPDIDIDFDPERRAELFTYVADKYGAENVLHICTYSRMNTKAAFQLLAKAHGISYPDRIRISKHLGDVADDDFYIPSEITENYPDLNDQLVRLAGVKRGISAHPAGVIIAEPSAHIRKLVPEMYIGSSKRFVAQFDLDAVEAMGLLKMDFLGLRTLKTIKESLMLIKEPLDPDLWVPDEETDDKDVYAMLESGKVGGVFQMEGPTNARGIQSIGCNDFESIVSCTALFRTGPIMAGFPKQFIENRQMGKKNVKYATPELRSILEETEGVILYQEQVMEIGSKLAGFDDILVDDIKEAIKHKKSNLMKSMRPKFVKGCVANGITEQAATKMWNQIELYSGYSYTRAHAVAYSFISYQTARLKCFWPHEFLTALLRTVADKEKRSSYLREALDLGIEILPPHINKSEILAIPVRKRNAIRFGFADIGGIGAKQAAKILEGRPEGGYEDIEQVLAAVKNKAVMEALKQAGALTSLGKKTKPEWMEARLDWQFYDNMEVYRKNLRKQVRLPEDGFIESACVAGEIVTTTKGKTQKGDPFMTWKIRWSPTQHYTIRLWSDSSKIWRLKKGSVVMVTGDYEPRWENISISDHKRVKVIYDQE